MQSIHINSTTEHCSYIDWSCRRQAMTTRARRDACGARWTRHGRYLQPANRGVVLAHHLGFSEQHLTNLTVLMTGHHYLHRYTGDIQGMSKCQMNRRVGTWEVRAHHFRLRGAMLSMVTGEATIWGGPLEIRLPGMGHKLSARDFSSQTVTGYD